MASRTVRTDLMLRQRNATASAIMRAIVRHGPTGRKGLAALTGVTFTTITKTVTELIELGALIESEPAAQRGVGRPVVPLDLAAPGRLVIGAHLHPGRTTCGAYTPHGEQVWWRGVEAHGRTRHRRIEEAVDLVADLVSEVGNDNVVGIGITTPWAELHHGEAPPQLVDVDHDELRAALQERLRYPVRAEPNVRALAVEHYWWNQGGSDVLTVLVGRSVRVAQVRDGDLVGDDLGVGGLVSHIVVPGSTFRCECGQVGCVKATCTDDALVRRAVDAGLLPPGSSQHDLYRDPDNKGLQKLRRARAEELGRVIPLIMGVIAPTETAVHGRLGTPEEIEACVEAIRTRYRELVGRPANVRYYRDDRRGLWARASAALALDRYLASPLEQEHERAPQAVATD